MTPLQSAFTLFGALCWLCGVFSVLTWQSVFRLLERGDDDEFPM
jgi:hypothetical protein